jgi:hypothetical protein
MAEANDEAAIQSGLDPKMATTLATVSRSAICSRCLQRLPSVRSRQRNIDERPEWTASISNQSIWTVGVQVDAQRPGWSSTASRPSKFANVRRPAEH